ncbi:5768_t:CDS:10 [Ambispora leptoticha]|uniref:5768_t:CDS:1 n=1 Tax=Ambispora leptoticha TaxID=144679 RepID=A0A9N8V5P9_9GLOM|nr:5768_t:CDS:10 [Ambispora leptoticha]
MDSLHFKVEQLKSLWAEYRIANQGFGTDYGDQSEWARKKLSTILTEFDKLIQEQVVWKLAVASEIEDLFAEIEVQCRLFGRQIDNVLEDLTGPALPTNNTTRDYLKRIRDSLNEEITTTRENINKWIDGVTLFAKELQTDVVVPPKEIFENDLSASVIQPVWYKYDYLYQIASVRRNSFEDNTSQLHFYFDKLKLEPSDDTEKALIQLFLDKATPKDINEILAEIQNYYNLKKSSESPNDTDINNVYDDDEEGTIKSSIPYERSLPPSRDYVYYSSELPDGLNLTEEQLTSLKQKLVVFEKEYIERKERRDKIEKEVTRLWDELKMPENEKQVTLKDTLEEKYLDQLSEEHERLREIMRVIIQKAIDEYTIQLGELWDKCLVPQNERDEFFIALREISSAEEVYERLAQEVDRLQELYLKCASIYRLMLERRALIEKMIEFEKKASDPNRLFQSSFRLLEEEKWRKTCWPNLVKIEESLIKACLEYEENERKPFMHESVRYLDTLQNEISERIVNQMFFGFEQSANKGAKPNGSSETPRASRRDSSAASRPGSPTSRSSRAPSRRTSMYFNNNGSTTSRPASRAVSPNRRTNTLDTSRPVSRPVSRQVSPSRLSKRRSTAFLGVEAASRSRPVSRAASPSPNSKAPSRRSSVYFDKSSNDKTVSSTSISRAASPNRIKRRSSLYLDSNAETSEKEKTGHSRKSSASITAESAASLSADSSSASTTTSQPKRSNSLSSNSSSSSLSSVATPSTPEPHVVNGRLAVSPSPQSKSKLSNNQSKDSKTDEVTDNGANKSNIKITRGIPRPAAPTRTPSAPVKITPPPRNPARNATVNLKQDLTETNATIRKRPSVNGLRPRPLSIASSTTSKKAPVSNKRMSVILDGGR